MLTIPGYQHWQISIDVRLVHCIPLVAITSYIAYMIVDFVCRWICTHLGHCDFHMIENGLCTLQWQLLAIEG